MKRVALISSLLFLCTFAFSKDDPIKVSTITNATEPSSAEVIKVFRGKLGFHPNLFLLVDNSDVSQGLVITVDCMKREVANAPYVCFYTNHYAGATSKSLLGGGVYVGATANDIADSFVGSVAQDIVESLNKVIRGNNIEELEACLFLTQSSCAVPNTLVPELKVKTLNLSQYLQKGGLKK